MLETLTLQTFAPLLHTSFRAHPDPDRTVELVLIEAEDLGSTPYQERFSLLLRGPLDTFLPQAMYPMEHEALGPLELFITPVRKETDGFVYQAVFNRLIAL